MEIILFHVEKKKLVNILVFELYLFDRLIVLLINNSTVIFSGNFFLIKLFSKTNASTSEVLNRFHKETFPC